MLEESVQYLKGIGPKKSEILKSEAGIETIEDLLYYAPRRYVDRSSFKSIVDTFTNEVVTVAGTISSVAMAGRRKKYLEVTIDDGTDTLCGIFFGGIRYFKSIFQDGDYVLFSGKVDFFNNKQIVHPEFDFIDEESRIKSINTGRVVPLYRSTEKLKGIGLDSRGFRRIIRSAIDSYLKHIDDPIDEALRKRLNMIPLKDALFSLHYPDTYEAAELARTRLAFNELFFLQYYLSISRRYTREEYQIEKKNDDSSHYEDFLTNIPFELTSYQKRAIEEIRYDLHKPYPMTRLLQGDVGSGKTIVAMAASLFTIGRGDQAAIMAPTGVLVKQHYNNFEKLMPGNLRLALLTGSTPAGRKKEIYEQISKGDIDIVIGTHALIQDKVNFMSLGLIVIDEQHRFGVNQRAKLREKGQHPDLLIMTATPIPRSLSLTLYGDLDVSYIKEKPASMLPIKTMSFPESRIRGVYNSVKKYITQERQVFFVLPLIQESEKIDLKSAFEVYNDLSNNIFPHLSVEILHGKMKQDEKDSIMRRFMDGEINILVSTTVIEVGIDAPNANIMVIEHAERFGLSQLHQLRGRVGRGEYQSFCALVYPDDISDESRKRIETIVAIDDGFKIAEEDLKLRGSGDILGIKQHGYNTGFEFANLVTDIELILIAKEEAEKIVSDIDDVHDIFDNIQKGNRLSILLKGIRTKRILLILS